MLGIIVFTWFITTIIYEPNSGPNKFMRFTHDTTSSQIYVYYMLSTLIMRFIAAGFFASALFKMYTSMKKVIRLKDSVSSHTFVIHFCSMLFYIIGRMLDSIAYS